ncbi:hypothetical protein KEM54_002860 [Ascosphaera aggregata]|nr:hypothetical protein KEM54_002860 [Ascosphaera aggregata]
MVDAGGDEVRLSLLLSCREEAAAASAATVGVDLIADGSVWVLGTPSEVNDKTEEDAALADDDDDDDDDAASDASP